MVINMKKMKMVFFLFFILIGLFFIFDFQNNTNAIIPAQSKDYIYSKVNSNIKESAKDSNSFYADGYEYDGSSGINSQPYYIPNAAGSFKLLPIH